MEESRTKRVSINIVFGLISKLCSIIFPFITRTVLIYSLGTKYLGLNSLFTAILQVLNLSELGIGSALVYNMYKPMAEKNTKEVSKLLNFYKKCYIDIGIIVLILGLILLPFIQVFINGDVPVDINIYILFGIYLLNSVICYFFFAYRQSLIIASQINDIISKVNTFLIFLQNLIQTISLLMFKNYYIYIFVLPVITLLNNIIIFKITNKEYSEYKPIGNISKEELKEIKKNIKGLFLQKIGGIILSSIDSIVISMYMSIEILGIYNNYYYIISSLIGVMGIILEAIRASIGNSVVLESKEKNFADFKKFNFMYVWIVSWITIAFMCLSQDFIRLWIGEKYLLSYNIVILFSIYFFVHKWGDMLYMYQEVNGLWWENRYTQLIGAILNLILNIISIQYIGLYGVLLSTIISVVFVLDIGFFYVLFKKYFSKKEWKKEYIKSQFYYVCCTAIVAYIMHIICINIEFSLILFTFKCLLVFLLPNILFVLLYFCTEEFQETYKFIYNKFILKFKKG